MEVFVSYGELLDKFSILEIKREKINNQHVQNEINVLMEKINQLLIDPNLKFYYQMLKLINLEIWNLSDQIRENKDSTLCLEIIKHNDRRFRVKNKINRSSPLKEQKSYPKQKCVFLGHLESGDQLTNVGIVRYLSTIYDEVFVVSKPLNAKHVRSLYSDDDNINIIEMILDYSTKPNFVFENVVATGNFGEKKLNLAHFYNDFYSSIGLNPEFRFSYHHLPRNFQIERELMEKIIPKDCSGYVFAHTRPGSSFEINSDLFIFDVSQNRYPEGHRWFKQWKIEYQNILLINFSSLIENASELYLSDSSFFCLASYLNLPETQVKNCFIANRYYDPSVYPSTNQKWNFV